MRLNIIISNIILNISLLINAKCYSCAGTCYSEPCNCQIGSCESSDYCYIERKPTDIQGLYRITKGCIKRPLRTHTGCDYDRFNDHILCVCKGEFCNDMIYIGMMSRRNVTCRNCSERDPNCDQLCIGEWCHEDLTTGASGCGYGPPSLPYFYKGPELLYHRTRLCITMSRGLSKAHKYCICNTNNCNAIHKNYYPWVNSQMDTTKSSYSSYDNKKELALHRCVSCEISSSDANIISSCKQNTCIAHFCTYNTRRLHNSNSPFMNERQGCINVTDDYQVRCSSSSKHYDSTTMQMQFGCSHKWMNNEEEELLCACRGDKCNRDLLSASQNNHISIYHHSFVHLLLSLFVITIL